MPKDAITRHACSLALRSSHSASVPPNLHPAGVSESIIMGIPMPTGTGLFKVLQKPEAAVAVLPRQRPPPLLAF